MKYRTLTPDFHGRKGSGVRSLLKARLLLQFRLNRTYQVVLIDWDKPVMLPPDVTKRDLPPHQLVPNVTIRNLPHQQIPPDATIFQQRRPDQAGNALPPTVT